MSVSLSVLEFVQFTEPLGRLLLFQITSCLCFQLLWLKLECAATKLSPSSLFAWGVAEGYKWIDSCFLEMTRLRATRDLYRAVTSELKGDASPIYVSLQSPRAGGFRWYFHIYKDPQLLCFHTQMSMESLFTGHSWLCKKIGHKWQIGQFLQSLLAWSKGLRQNPWSRVTLLGGSMSHFLPHGKDCVNL